MKADIVEYAIYNPITPKDLEDLKSGDPQRIFPVYMGAYNDRYIKHFVTIIDNIEKITGKEVMVELISPTYEFESDRFACQLLHGDTDVLLGFSGSDKSLLYIASSFAGEEFEDIDENSYDALCEFTNCANGRFATLIEKDDVELDIDPPMCCDNCKIKVDSKFYVMKIKVDDRILDIVSVIDDVPYMS